MQWLYNVRGVLTFVVMEVVSLQLNPYRRFGTNQA